MNKVTIIIPVYVTTEEGIKWLDECLSSALGQKGASVVVCNDGSPVDIMPVISKYIKEIDYTISEHKGVSRARNIAASKVQTELFIPLDCDDRFVEGAIDKLLEYWDGHTPVYPDVTKFGVEIVPHYPIMDFHCDHLYNHVGYTSVNVLQKAAYWKELGGWNENLILFEDGEYNNRLMGIYCGRRCPFPLVEYRMHPNQRTKTLKRDANKIAKQILASLRSRDMPCPGCSKKKSSASTSQSMFASTPKQSDTTTINVNDVVATVPLEFNGRVLAVYIGGKGKGKHYYRGLRSGETYNKVTYGTMMYANPQDVRGAQDYASQSLLVRVDKTSAQQPSAPTPEKVLKAPPKQEVEAVEESPMKAELPEEQKKPPVKRTARKAPKRTPKKDTEE